MRWGRFEGIARHRLEKIASHYPVFSFSHRTGASATIFNESHIGKAMKKAEKESAVLELREKFTRARVVVLADFSGMSVGELQEAKGHARQGTCDLKVVKNTVAIRASVGTILEKVAVHFAGPTAVIFGYGDPILPAKAIKILSEKQKKLKIKVGILENRVVDLSDFKKIAQLPQKPVLLGQLVLRLKSPLAGLHGSLSGLLNQLVCVLQAAHEKRSSA